MSNSTSKVTLNAGPAIHVIAELDEHGLKNTRLELSKQAHMSYELVGGTKDIQKTVVAWLEAYTHKTAGKTPPFSLFQTTPFIQKVWKVISAIPHGSTTSYQQIAQTLGTATSARAVGTACGRNPYPLFVPCHRVIRSDGGMGGFAFDIEIKKRLIEFEDN